MKSITWLRKLMWVDHFEMPHATAMMTGLGVLNILDAVRQRTPEAKFLQASSSELFGNTTSKTKILRSNRVAPTERQSFLDTA
jgi:GDP-D-mannose dehydratase